MVKGKAISRVLMQVSQSLASILQGMGGRSAPQPVANTRIRRLRSASGGRHSSCAEVMARRQLAEAALNDRLNRAMASGKLTDCLENIVSEVAAKLGTEYVFLSLLEGNPSFFWVVAYKGSFTVREIALPDKFMVEQYASGKTVKINNLRQHFNALPLAVKTAGLGAMAGAPILINGELSGVLEVFFTEHRGELAVKALSSAGLNLLQVYARQSAVAVRMTKLNSELEQKSQELQLCQEVAQIVANQPSAGMLLTKVGSLLQKFWRADGFAAFIVQQQGLQTLLQAVHNQDISALDMAHLQTLFSQPEWLQLRQDSAQSALRVLQIAPGKTLNVLPLFFRQSLQGMLVLNWEYERDSDYSRHTEACLETIAVQVAMGLDREHLYGSIKKIGLTDALTEIPNRRFFDYILNREFKKVRRYGHQLTLLMIDIDFFKKINDTWGHQTGDIILREIGALLKGQFRATDLPARYGGEEFAVILPETPANVAAELAEKLRGQVANKIFAAQTKQVSLTISIGTATIDGKQDLLQMVATDLVLAADHALYQAKNSGRNRVEFYEWEQGLTKTQEER